MFHTYMSGVVAYGVNKIYAVVISVTSIILCGVNIYITLMLYTDIKKRCTITDEVVCLGSQSLVKDVVFYFMIVAHSLIALYLLIKLPHLKIALKTTPYCSYLTRNKHTYLFQLIITMIKVILNLLFVIAIGVQVSTGYNENFKVGNTFYVPEVRAAFYDWINYIAFAVIIVMWILTNLIIKVIEQFFASAIFSQWYFNKNKLWIKNSNRHILRQLRFHLGSFIKYALVIFWAHKVGIVLEKIKFYLDSIEPAKKRHRIIIVLAKPLVYMYERYFKYHNEQVIFDIAIFGRTVHSASFRSYYLKFRNWSRFNVFYKGFGVHSSIGGLLIFNTIYLFVVIWVTFIRRTFYDNIDFAILSYLLYYPLLFSAYFYFLFSESCSILNTSYELLVFCFVVDEEMYQSDQKFCDAELLAYMDSVSTPSEKVYLRKIVQEQGVTKKLDEKFGKLIAKKVREDDIDKISNADNQDNYENEVIDDDYNDNNEDFTIRVKEPENEYKAKYYDSDLSDDDEPQIVTERDNTSAKDQVEHDKLSERAYSNTNREEYSLNPPKNDLQITNDNKSAESQFLTARNLRTQMNKPSMESVKEEVNLIEYIKRKKEKIRQQNMEYLNDKKTDDNNEYDTERNDNNDYVLDPNSIAATMLKQLKKQPVKKAEEGFKVVIQNKHNPND